MGHDPKVPPDFTFSVAKILNNLANAQMHAQVMSRENYIRGDAREAFNMVARRCKMAQGDIMGLMGEESKKIIDQNIINSDSHIQLEGITTAIIAMPEGIRNEIEDYVMARYKIYAINLPEEKPKS